jgi:Transglycosylase SLT domain
MATEAPKSFQDPLYADLDAKTETKLGLPVGLLSSIRTRGERSNADQVSEAGARSVYQVIPSTRDAVLKKYGIDAYLSPENAAEAAGLLLKESLKRNGGDPAAAVGEYHGGTDRANWGPRTQAYIGRVMSGQSAAKTSALENDFAKFMASNPAVPAGRSASAVPAPAAATPDAAPSPALEAGFAQYLQANPPAPSAAEPKEMNLLERTREAITGTERRTPTTDSLPDWATMPELNQLSLASAKTGLGTLLSNPAETAQIIKANFPGAQVRQDEKGNFLIRSAADGQEYAIKPGFQVSDIPRAVGALAAFTPAGRAATIPGAAVGAGLTQAAIEGTQAATGGTFDPKEVALATAFGGAVPAIARAGGAAIDAGKAGLARIRGVPEPAVNPAQAAREAAVVAPEAAPPTAATPVAPAAPVAPATPAVAPLAAADLAQTAKTAAEGGMGSSRATRVLADQAAPDVQTVAAAKRLGIEEHLQPDHVTTNQAYRELAQAVKSIPGSEARAAEMQGLEKIGQRADDLISEIGGTTDASTLSSTIKARMQATQSALEAQADALYARVRQEIPLNAEAPAPNVLGFIKQRADELGGVANLSPMEKKIVARLTPKAVSKTETVASDPAQAGLMLPGWKPTQQVTTQTLKQPTYALLDDVRKDVGAAARMAGPFKDADTGLAKKLYSLITTDQSAVVGSHGAADLFNAAKASVAVRKGLEDDLTSLFGKSLDNSLVGALSSAVRALPQGDAAKLVRLVASVPNDLKQQVVASGVASAFRTAGTRGPINFTTYAKWYEGLLRNKQAYAAVMSNLPQAARKQLSDLYRVSKGISAASRERITTGRIQAVMDEFKGPDNLAGRLYETAKRSALSAGAGTAAGAVMGPGVGAAVASALARGAKPNAIKAADALIASPEFAQLARQGGNEAAKVRRFAYSQSFTRYVRAVGSPRELSNREKWVMQVMQGRNNSQD